MHSCCGPCSTRIIEVLKNSYEVSLFYFNPCIYPKEEYDKRLSEQKRYTDEMGIKVYEGEHDEEAFLKLAIGLEKEKEGGLRCEVCFRMRLAETKRMADALGIKLFTTTLTVSPHKDAKLINKIGSEVGGDNFLCFDFKKDGGYARSVQLSKEYGLYRQNYCGCRFSKERS